MWKFGNHVNTDLIIAGRYLDDYSVESLAEHAMEDLDPSFSSRVGEGDVIVAGRNFGCGSSREQAPLVLRHKGIRAVFALSMARIFYRNAINIGLPVVVHPDPPRMLEDGEEVTVDLEGGTVSRSDGTVIRFDPLPDHLLEILSHGGLVPYLRSRLG
ncbi:MAG: 3-isopropylmalate dehydratase small subunit [Methanomassiliicoccales archaeon]